MTVVVGLVAAALGTIRTRIASMPSAAAEAVEAVGPTTVIGPRNSLEALLEVRYKAKTAYKS